jgi:DNA recombination protein RmuC
MTDTAILIGIIIFLILAFGIFVFLINKKLSSLVNPSDQGNSLLLQNQINSVVQSLDYKLSETNKIINDQLHLSNERLHLQSNSNNDLLRKISENNNQVLKEVTEKLTRVEDTNRQVVGFAEQLQSLEKILKNPKQRGLYGEYYLETILANVLPKSIYKVQYPFIDGVIVDAVILASDKIVPIDAKFSLEAYNRMCDAPDVITRTRFEKEFISDVKKRIDETSKYIKPEENTINVAFMFVPADGVYQEIIKIGTSESTFDIINYAYSHKVVIVSPTSFFAYLQTVLQALNTLQIEGKLLDIVKYLNESTRYLKEFEENMNKVGKNIITLSNSFNRASDDARKLSSRISKVTNNQENLIGIEKVESD